MIFFKKKYLPQESSQIEIKECVEKMRRDFFISFLFMRYIFYVSKATSYFWQEIWQFSGMRIKLGYILGKGPSINNVTPRGKGGGYKNWEFGVIFKA